MMTNVINLGESVVFEEVYKLYYPSLRFFAAKYVGDEESEDIIENLFFRLWTQKKTFMNVSHMQASLYQSTKNACLDFIKMSGRKHRNLDFINLQSSTIENDHLHDIIRSEVVSEIYRAINNLPLQCRKVIHLEFIDGLNNEEIAKELALSIQTVKNHKVRALKILRQQLSGNGIALALVVHILCR
ncbi:RNA polymerase sigma-70 factor [Olivibacter sp. SDN3]|uniref:RNA polymerase sigma-70 factor n=1 Tax=Olivibacter sp. SDN3 TaxID=2764720 RepID=UPI0016518EDF|nr:RNA polymerase sigma-70 factor [Olivibacter sp. SDN3]QNL48384.1 RNA polymerase sigma-70 factor [Olivibacter sp. SDN3]